MRMAEAGFVRTGSVISDYLPGNEPQLLHSSRLIARSIHRNTWRTDMWLLHISDVDSRHTHSRRATSAAGAPHFILGGGTSASCNVGSVKGTLLA